MGGDRMNPNTQKHGGMQMHDTQEMQQDLLRLAKELRVVRESLMRERDFLKVVGYLFGPSRSEWLVLITNINLVISPVIKVVDLDSVLGRRTAGVRSSLR